jgi:RHS repeat-associated protein
LQPAPTAPITITGSTTYTTNPLNQYTAITGTPNPTYDADGNTLTGLRSPLADFTATWNGENRMLTTTSANLAAVDRRVESACDALGRRVRKTVKFASTGAVIDERYFIYDGWNVIEESIAPASGPVETADAVWGADLSGTAQGAGGVGGLLLRETTATGASYYHYDGNGNVTALTSPTGTVQAGYTYGPFGETLSATGPIAASNPWRFSTKYQDDETGLLYYGYRFYNTIDGRWPSRDPIEEEGGVNLYAMVLNAPVNTFDLLGNEPPHVEANPKCQCSCEWISDILMESKDRRKQSADIPKFGKTLIGAELKVTLKRNAQEKAERGVAELEWLEVASRFEDPDVIKLGGKPNTVTDMMKLFANKKNSTLDPWRNRPCLSTGMEKNVTLTDRPQFGMKGGWATLWIKVRIKNPPCAPANIPRTVEKEFYLEVNPGAPNDEQIRRYVNGTREQ